MGNITRRNLLGHSVGAAAASTFGFNIRRARAADFTYKFANNSTTNHPLNVAAIEMVERIKEESGGRLVIEIFPDNQLGGDSDMFAQLRSGAIHFFTLPGPILGGLLPVAGIDGIGFAFSNYEKLWAAMDGDLGKHVRGEMLKVGLVGMEKAWDNGFRQISSSTRQILSVDDMSGFRIRVPVGPLWTSMFKTLGAAPTSINFKDLYIALQTGTVDGQENPLNILEFAKFFEVQKHCALTNHMWVGYWFVANARAWQALPKDLQEIAERNMAKAAEKNRKLTRDLNENLQGALERKGMKFNVPDVASFRNKLKAGGFYSDWKTKFGAQAWAILEKYADGLA